MYQEPKQARMCGVGGKGAPASLIFPFSLSNRQCLADRRPIDPPPIVQLRVYDTIPSDPNDPNSANNPAHQ
ncbi:11016_t:CDS:2, partial [Acaulospora colombiana]